MSFSFMLCPSLFFQVGITFTMSNILSFFIFLLPFLVGNNRICVAEKVGFVGRNGTQFVLNGERVYLNGFNAYWMMTTAADTASRGRATVTKALRQASAVGMNVARIWGFNEGDYLPLQISPGSYSEDVFKVTLMHKHTHMHICVCVYILLFFFILMTSTGHCKTIIYFQSFSYVFINYKIQVTILRNFSSININFFFLICDR